MTNATVNLLGNYDLSSNNLNNVVIQNGMAYLPAGEQGLFLVDVKNPSSPKLVKQLDSLGYVYDVTVSGKTAFVVSTASFEGNSFYLGQAGVRRFGRNRILTGVVTVETLDGWARFLELFLKVFGTVAEDFANFTPRCPVFMKS